VKTKRAMKEYKCYLCKDAIPKGQQYARKSILLGYSGTWGHSKDCQCCGGVMPQWAYSEPMRTTEPVCESCANGKEG
jgi:hypothetical protein